MSELSIKSKFEIKELELNALLEITQAINSNLPEESLYKIYNFTLRSNLNIEKLAFLYWMRSGIAKSALVQKRNLPARISCLSLKRSRI
jgi:hypothetical protein